MRKKDSQIQIRVNKELKEILHLSAQRAGQELSSWILAQVVPNTIQQWLRLCAELKKLQSVETASFVFAEIHDLLSSLSAKEVAHLFQFPPVEIAPEPLAHLGSMLEHVANLKKVPVPNWISEIPPLETPYFGSSLSSLRLHLLTKSPAAYRKRNIFIDAPVGGRV